MHRYAQNETKKEVIISRGMPLATVKTAEVASLLVKRRTSEKSDPGLIDFGDSPIPKEWRKRLRQKLCCRRNVFSLHEGEVGLAKGVEHHICLSDSWLEVSTFSSC